MAFRVTYATLSADNEEMHAAYDNGIEAGVVSVNRPAGGAYYVQQDRREQSRTVVGA